LQATGLVNEAYLKLIDQRRVDWRNRAHFFAIAAQLMRRILLDHARGRLRDKRGGDAVKVPVDAVPIAAPDSADPVDVIAVDRALHKLEQLDPDQARIVELRFFGGMTVDETAEVLGVSRATVKREWAVAKAWLYQNLTRGRVKSHAMSEDFQRKRWRRVKALFTEALERRADERSRFLIESDADEAMRLEVAALLVAYEAGGDLFEWQGRAACRVG
jgi:RNA polymerase sigma factor (TIGR02999 family)